MPWHDVGCVFVGTAACDISRHFIQRWNQIRVSYTILLRFSKIVFYLRYSYLSIICY
ncbi:unnamed protein product [Schistosoma curassoni]|nr:unnamed protein product [Schistosoma curassoni]